jgi:hypothetical protein
MTPRDCEHGQLARVCRLCDLEDEVIRLTNIAAADRLLYGLTLQQRDKAWAEIARLSALDVGEQNCQHDTGCDEPAALCIHHGGHDACAMDRMAKVDYRAAATALMSDWEPNETVEQRAVRIVDAAIAAARKVERDVPFKGFGASAICPGGCRCDRCTGLL